ncbi:MAG: hypothetical protein RIS47_2323 [Bacteroidota bacterium]|jgi:hypothetical protein
MNRADLDLCHELAPKFQARIGNKSPILPRYNTRKGNSQYPKTDRKSKK